MKTLKVKLLKSLKDRTFGLIGKNKPESIMFYTRFGIHTFGMKFPIDVLVLDDKDKVVKLIESLEPNKIFFWPFKFKKVLELPAGEIRKMEIKIGSKINTIIARGI